jgi:type I restriction enzyme, S subunit
MRAPVTNLDELVESGVIQLTRGKIISKRDIAACPGSFPVYSSAKENEGKLGEYGRYMFDEELITWSVDGGGRLFYRPRHKYSVTNVGGVLRIRDKKVLDYKYLYYALSLRHSEISFDWVKKAHPSVIKKLYRDIPVPPIPDQQRIVGILDKAFEGIAAAKANAERNLENARALFESRLKGVFIRPGKEWVRTTLGDEVDLLAGFAFKSTSYTNSGESIRLLRGDNIMQGSIRWDDVKKWPASDTLEYSRYQLRRGDVVLAMDRPWVKAGLKRAQISETDLPCLLVQRVARLRAGANLEDSFLMYLIGCSEFTLHLLAQQTGIGVPHISAQQIRDFEFARPPRAEQCLIVKKLDELNEATRRLERAYQQKLTALEQLKKSLLHQAFAGAL